MIITPIKTKIFRQGNDLIGFIRAHVRQLKEKDILVITSKIIALSENRVCMFKSKRTKEQLIKEESAWAMKTKYTWLTVKDGTVMAAAGIDESNADGKLILLPKDSFKSAAEIRKVLQRAYGLKKLGVLITDSRLMPLRAGVVGIALGYAGFKGIRDYRGKPDIFGRKLKVSRTDVADSLATAAVVEMGEGNEQQPLAVITRAPVEWTEHVNKRELMIDIADDIYRPLFKRVGRGYMKLLVE